MYGRHYTHFAVEQLFTRLRDDGLGAGTVDTLRLLLPAFSFLIHTTARVCIWRFATGPMISVGA